MICESTEGLHVAMKQSRSPEIVIELAEGTSGAMKTGGRSWSTGETILGLVPKLNTIEISSRGTNLSVRAFRPV